MADEPIYSDKDVFEAAGTGMVAALALAATSAGASLPVQGAMAAVGSLVGLGIGRYVHRASRRRFPKFAIGFLRWYDPDPEKAQAKAEQTAEQHKDDPSYHDVMFASFRQMMEAADESVIETLGYLAGVYTGGNKKPDSFFRSLGRFLCELEPGELEQFKDIAQTMCMTAQSTPIYATVDGNGWVWASLAGGGGRSNRKVRPAAQRLFTLLKREGLGGNVPIDQPKYGAGPVVADKALSIDALTVAAILKIVDPEFHAGLPTPE